MDFILGDKLVCNRKKKSNFTYGKTYEVVRIFTRANVIDDNGRFCIASDYPLIKLDVWRELELKKLID